MTETQKNHLEHWASVIREAYESGEQIKDWISVRGITRSQFYYWYKKVKEHGYLPEGFGPMNSGAQMMEPATTSVPVIAEIHLTEERPLQGEHLTVFSSQVMIMKNNYQVYVGKDFYPEALKSVMEVLSRC